MKPRQTLILGIIVAALIAGILIYQKVWLPRKEKAKQEQAFPGFSKDGARKIQISHGEYKDALEKKRGKWVVASDADYPADEDGIEECLDMIGRLDNSSFISGDPQKQDRFELSDEKGLHVQILGADDKTLAEFLIGKRGSASTSYYFRKAGQDNIYLAYENLLDSFNREHSTWKDKTIFKFLTDDARELEILSQDGAVKLAKNPEKDLWELVEGEERTEAKKWVVNDIVSSLSRFKTLEFPEDKDLKEIGLDPAKKHILVKLADGTLLTLLVGDEGETSGRTYVKRADSPTLFLVSSFQVKKFFKERDELIEEEGDEDRPSFLPPPVLEQPAPSPKESP